jgi:pimeloyl-ACP methyl ester carboxylesterase
VWRHSRQRDEAPTDDESGTPDPAERTEAMWRVVEQLHVPVLLVRGMEKSSILRDEHEAELLRRLPSATVARVEGAGHSVQGDRPIELAALIQEFAP